MNINKQARLIIGIVLIIIYFLIVGMINFILNGILGGIGSNLISVGIPATGATLIFKRKLKKIGSIIFSIISIFLSSAVFNTLFYYENVFGALLIGGFISIFYIVGIKIIYSLVNEADEEDNKN